MTRQEKIQKVKDRKSKSQRDLLDAYAKLVSTLDAGLDINADELLDKLAEVSTLTPAVDDLRKAVEAFKVPELRDTIEVKGLQSLIDTISSIKAAKQEVAVQLLDSKSISKLTTTIESLTKATKDKIFISNTAPEDFIPVRRVRSIGSRLIFDDDTHGGAGGGGIDKSGLATSEKQDSIIDSITSSISTYGIQAISDDGTYKYFFFENDDTNYYVMRKNLTTKVFSYTKGTGSYTTVYQSDVLGPSGSPTWGTRGSVF